MTVGNITQDNLLDDSIKIEKSSVKKQAKQNQKVYNFHALVNQNTTNLNSTTDMLSSNDDSEI